MARSESHPQDFGTVELELANGAHVCGCFCDHGVPDNTYVVFGDEGKAALNFTRPVGVALYRREFSRSYPAKLLGYIRQAPRIASAIRLGTPAGRLSSYRSQWQHFLACIESHSRAKPDFEDGLAVTRVVDQLLGSVNGLASNRGDSGKVVLAS
jgi:predicted dehydrogenase